MHISGMFSKKDDGTIITRPAVCRCGRDYTQSLLSARFMKLVEHRGKAAMSLFMREVPDLFVPVDCPRCESHNLARGNVVDWGQQSAFRIVRKLEDRTQFAVNMARLMAAFNKPQDDETVAGYWLALGRSMTDDEFAAVVVEAIRTEKKWPFAATLARIAADRREGR